MRAQEKWDRENSRQIFVRLYSARDAEILAWWENIPKGEKADTFRRMAKKEIEKKE